jgi:hypothetical protein
MSNWEMVVEDKIFADLDQTANPGLLISLSLVSNCRESCP